MVPRSPPVAVGLAPVLANSEQCQESPSRRVFLRKCYLSRVRRYGLAFALNGLHVVLYFLRPTNHNRRFVRPEERILLMSTRYVRNERTFITRRCAPVLLFLSGLLFSAPPSRAQVSLRPATLAAALHTSFLHTDTRQST